MEKWSFSKSGEPFYSKASGITMIFSLALPLLWAGILYQLLGHEVWRNETLHSSLEAIGAFIGLLMAPLLWIQTNYDKKKPHLICIGGGLLCMGILNLSHAFDPSGSSFAWNRTLGNFLGGLLFAAAWFPPNLGKRNGGRTFLWQVGIATLLLELALLPFSNYFQAPAFESGPAQDLRILLNSLGSLGFFLSSLFFLKKIKSERSTSHLVFANYALLFTTSTLIFGFSSRWEATWWFFHLLRLGSHLIILSYFVSSFRDALFRGLLNQASLEKQVAQRTSELAHTNSTLLQEINNRRETERELQISRSQLEATLHAVRDRMVVFDMQGRVVFMNHIPDQTQMPLTLPNAREEMFEEISLFEELEDGSERLLKLEDWPVSRVMRGETLTDWELRMVHKRTGTELFLLFSGEPIQNLKKQQVLTIILARDITHLRNAEKSLRESEANLRELADSMPQIVWVTGPEGDLRFFNQKWVEYTGAIPPKGALKFDVWSSLLHPDDIELAMRIWDQSLKSGTPFQVEYRILQKNTGQYRWYLGRALPIRNKSGQVFKWIGTCTDIHEQKTLTERLRENEERLSLATTAADIGTWEWDVANNVGKTSKAFAKMFELPNDSTFKLDEVFERIFEDDRPRVDSEIKQALSWKSDFASEFRVHHRNGSIRWLMLRGRFSFSSSGRPLRMFGISMDITERKEMEDRLRLTAKRANEANELKSAFLANMSHEIRTPLGVILGFTDLLHDPNLAPAEKENIFAIIQRNGEQLSTLINDILDLSKVEAGQFTMENLRLNFRELLQEVVAIMEPKATKKGLRLNYHVDDNVPEFIGSDPTRLRQILLNIIGNAVKFTEKGSILVQARCHQKGNLDILIQDTGIGLTERQIEKLFRPFSQADESTTRKFGGTGLGLALSRRLARALGGDLIIESSSPGVGSTFRLFVANHIVEATETELAGLKILVANDSADTREWISHLLEKHRASVKTADNGRGALDQALHENFDLVLMDLKMPIMDGLTATEKLRESGYKKPIIAITASAPRDLRRKCLKVGCTDQITIPVHPNDLVSLIARYAHVA